jgi:hypothetical protein
MTDLAIVLSYKRMLVATLVRALISRRLRVESILRREYLSPNNIEQIRMPNSNEECGIAAWSAAIRSRHDAATSRHDTAPNKSWPLCHYESHREWQDDTIKISWQ